MQCTKVKFSLLPLMLTGVDGDFSGCIVLLSCNQLFQNVSCCQRFHLCDNAKIHSHCNYRFPCQTLSTVSSTAWDDFIVDAPFSLTVTQSVQIRDSFLAEQLTTSSGTFLFCFHSFSDFCLHICCLSCYK